MGDEQGLQIDACERNPYARGIAGRDAGPWAKTTDLATQEACRATAGSIAIGRRASRAAYRRALMACISAKLLAR